MRSRKMLAVVFASVCAFSALTAAASAESGASASEPASSAATSEAASSDATSAAASSETASAAASSEAASAPASTPASNGESKSDTSPNTGIALGIAPALIAGAAIVLVASKKNK